MSQAKAKGNVLILGARGMLGTDLAREFSGESQLFLLDKEELDVTNEKSLKAQINNFAPSIIINATGYTDVAGAEKNRDLAFNLNTTAVRYIVEAASAIDAWVVHFSTEYVFNGQAETGYSETAEVSPLNIYGESKAKGEKIIRSYNRSYLVRSSWLYGQAPQRGKPRGLNFVDMVIKLADQQDVVQVVNDQFGKPTYTRDLAKAVKKLVTGDYSSGVYHLVNEDKATWYDIAKETYRLKDIKTPLVPISSAEYAGEVKRPSRAVLINTKFPRLRSWHEALADYLTK